MSQTVQCPYCGRSLAINSRHTGKAFCPICQELFRLATEEPVPPAAPAVPSSPGHDYAREQGLGPDEEHDEAALSKEHAAARLQGWKEDMPEVPSAYVPSGKMPVGGLVALAGGSVVGAVGGALAFLLALGITVALVVGLVALNGWMGDTCGRVLCILVIAEYALGLIGAAISYGALGWAAAAITTRAGFLGKNRNTTAAVLFSLAAAVFALALSHFPFAHLAALMMSALGLEGADQGWTLVDWLTAAVELLGALLALLCAGVFGSSMVHEHKFCEQCEEHMGEVKKRGLGLGATRALARALRDGKFEAAADLMGSPEGKCGVPTLFTCAKCGKGYLELQAKFKCTWKTNDDTQELVQDWLAASVPLTPEQVDLFRERRRKRRDDSHD
jgi:hypothetical protein